MKRAVLLVFAASLIALAVGQNRGNFNVRLRANNQERVESLIRCRGNVEMATDSFVLRADEVDYHSDSGMVQARGNVRLQLLPQASTTASAANRQHR